MFIIAKSIEESGIHYTLREHKSKNSDKKAYTIEVCDGIFEENPNKNMQRNDCEIKGKWLSYDKAMKEFLKIVS